MSVLNANITFNLETEKCLPPALRRKTCSSGVKEYAMERIEEMLRSCCDFPLTVQIRVTDVKTGRGVETEIQL